MFCLLKVGADKISDKLIQSVEERVTNIRRLKPGVKIDDVQDCLIDGFTKGKEFGFGGWSRQELVRAKQLAVERYSSKDWNFQR